jgi:hypothetical protein
MVNLPPSAAKHEPLKWLNASSTHTYVHSSYQLLMASVDGVLSDVARSINHMHLPAPFVSGAISGLRLCWQQLTRQARPISRLRR